MSQTYAQMARTWAAEDDSPVDFSLVCEQVEYFAANLFHEYKPTKAPREKRFLDRLSDWLNSAPDEVDRKVLLQLVTHLFFLGSDEFETLYQAAFDGPVARWLIDALRLKVDQASAQTRLRAAMRHTWFCAITDSMQISEFYHLNHIEGVEIRPVWRTLYEFRTDDIVERIDEYLNKKEFKRIVLLEDFVGSGNQMKHAVEFVASLPSQPSVLLCPMVICPKGADRARTLAERIDHLTYSPVLELPQPMFLSKSPGPEEDSFMQELRDTVTRLHPQLKKPKCRYPPFGFRDTGALVVMHTNCPNNTLPVIHHSSRDGQPWSPLFRRSERI